MADIVVFQQRRGGAPPAGMRAPTGKEPVEARILFFTGVRYERYGEAEGDEPLPRDDGSRRAGKR